MYNEIPQKKKEILTNNEIATYLHMKTNTNTLEGLLDEKFIESEIQSLDFSDLDGVYMKCDHEIEGLYIASHIIQKWLEFSEEYFDDIEEEFFYCGEFS